MSTVMDWSQANAALDGITDTDSSNEVSAETAREFQERADLMGYDFANIDFEQMPDNVGGYTQLDYDTDADGTLVIKGNDIYLNDELIAQEDRSYGPFEDIMDRVKDSTGFYDEVLDGDDTFYHELAHGKQHREIWERSLNGEEYMEEDIAAMLPLHEGQAVFNADGQTYPPAEAFYEEFVDRVYNEGEDPAAALHDVSDEYRLDVVMLEDDDEQLYQVIATPRDEDIDTEQLYQAVEETADMRVDREQSYEVDYRDADSRVAESIINVQEDIVEGYEAVMEEKGRDALPSQYEEVMDTLGYEPEPVEGSVEMDDAAGSPVTVEGPAEEYAVAEGYAIT